MEPYVADHEIESSLGYTGTPVSEDARAGLLGNLHQRKNRGRNLALFPTGQWLRLLDLTGDPQLATQATVSCSLGGVKVSDMPRVIGRIQWGSDGGTHEALFDFIHGTQLSIPSDGIRVDAMIEGNQAGVPQVIAGASVGYYPRGGLSPRRTILNPEIVDAQSAVAYDIPAFASHVSIGIGSVPATQTGAVVTVEFMSAGGGSMTFVTSMSTYEASRPIPIPNGATQVQVYNLLEEINVNQLLIFELFL